MKKIKYLDDAERKSILEIAKSNGEILIEEANLLEGNFLTLAFPNEIIQSQPTELDVLKAENESNKQAIAELTTLLSTLLV